MTNAPDDAAPVPGLRLLKALVIALAVTLIGGLLTIVAVIVIRFPRAGTVAVALPGRLPDSIRLPEGVAATAFTAGPGWYAVVAGREILIYDAETGTMRQRIALLP